jgi:hypothetical protein
MDDAGQGLTRTTPEEYSWWELEAINSSSIIRRLIVFNFLQTFVLLCLLSEAFSKPSNLITYRKPICSGGTR